MVRILASADIHLGSPIRSVALRNQELGERLRQASRDAFIKIVDLAISENVDALVLAGDIFDNDQPDLRARAFLITQLSRAAEASVPTVLIRGNHDALLDHKAHGELGADIHLLHKDNPTVEIGEAVFHGLSFDAAHISKSFLPDNPTPVPGKRNIGLMHTSLDGASGHDPYAPCAERELMAYGFDLWCLGHIHAPFERVDRSVMVVMPGITQPRHFGERRGGTVALVTLDGDVPKIERHDIGQLKFSECRLDLTACQDQQEVIRALREGLMTTQVQGYDVAVRLNVISDRYGPEIIGELAAELLENIEGVYLDKIKSSPPQSATTAETDDLIRLMREEISQDSFRQAALEQLEELRHVMPHELNDELEEDELDELLADAIAEIGQRLHSGAFQ